MINTPAARRGPARAVWTLAAFGLGICTLSSPALAQMQTGPELYHGDSVASAGIKLASWGSGAAEEDARLTYSGTNSLRIVTHGLYQGAGIVLGKPVDLGPYATNNAAYIQFAVMPPVVSPTSGTGAGGFSSGYPGAFSGGKGGGPQGPGSPGAAGGPGAYGGGQGGAGAGKATAVQFQKPHAMEYLRSVLVTTGGRSLAMMIPLDSASDDGQWKLASFPVAMIPGFRADDAVIKEIRLFGDVPGTMHIGKIGIVVDSTPLSVQSVDPKIVQDNVTYRYAASASGGATPVRLSWDWDASDGIQDETDGKSVTHNYRKSGEYIATVTASDLYGTKKPVSTTFKVHVP